MTEILDALGREIGPDPTLAVLEQARAKEIAAMDQIGRAITDLVLHPPVAQTQREHRVWFAKIEVLATALDRAGIQAAELAAWSNAVAVDHFRK